MSTRPWTNKSILIGLIAQDPITKQVKVLRTSGVTRRKLKTAMQVDEPIDYGMAMEALAQFLASLDQLVDFVNGGGKSSVGAVLKGIPDRGTSFQFSAVQRSDFKSLKEAFAFCQQKAQTKPDRPAAPGSLRTRRVTA